MQVEFTLDCVHLDRTAGFWCAAAGFEIGDSIPGRYLSLTGHGLAITLQHVPEPKAGKNRMHLDLLVDDLEGELRRLEALGATRITPTPRAEFGQTWYVLADPEGNEFCLAPVGDDVPQARWARQPARTCSRRMSACPQC